MMNGFHAVIYQQFDVISGKGVCTGDELSDDIVVFHEAIVGEQLIHLFVRKTEIFIVLDIFTIVLASIKFSSAISSPSKSAESIFYRTGVFDLFQAGVRHEIFFFAINSSL